ncbi:MAG: hypothetical protein OXF79_19340 [Chloroflexi bacterium]|nr:hypothetical protein [Chloroflexota bacterium]
MVSETEYRCEDCDKVLLDDDLRFDGEGVPLCAYHYEVLLEDEELDRWDAEQQAKPPEAREV